MAVQISRGPVVGGIVAKGLRGRWGKLFKGWTEKADGQRITVSGYALP